MKSLPAELLAVISSDSVPIIIQPMIEINHTGFASPLRYINYEDQVIIDSIAYEPKRLTAAFQIDSKSTPTMSIGIDDVDRVISNALEAQGARDKFTATTGLVAFGAALDPVAFWQYSNWRVAYSIKRGTVSLALSAINFQGASWPQPVIDPVHFPAAFNQGVN